MNSNSFSSVSKTIGKMVVENRGVLRKVISLGVNPLPKIMRKAGDGHFQGSQFLMLFDSSATVQSEILRSLRNDPRVLRVNVFKVNDSTNLNVASSVERARASF
ncbi:unnamed protein product [Kuraishia capsulata CBS 1993]|uniref:Uncharacterized protein n=1 Tax=Kuraishia capsulata CBS 1993 TaxID=1382522 RepID=W6MPX6_9ASCO|nr:uncharacterized protein KUCA_T00004370001 [Kuraishia capsulata CBS 1993]CDK28388.1 unnamed protein product [Kuraishia capsulata CBS 1993]